MTANTHERVRQLSRNFKNWLQQNVETGIDGHGAKTDYISYSKLRSYWTHDRIGTILGHHEKDVDIDKVQYRFVQVVSVLTYISDDSHILTEYLVDFYRTDVDDHSLPLPTPNERLNRIPPPFHDDPVGPQVWRQFSGHQWKFLPLHFEPKEGVIDRIHPLRTLDPRHIIPITIESELSRRSGRGARVVKAQPHEASGLSSEFIVLKIYDRERYFDEFMKERNTYTTIRNMRRIATIDVFKYFLRYHGCYIQGNNCVLLIEYANQGSLLEFFHKNWYLPRTKDEAQDLWIELGQLFKGLALLHNGGKHNSSIHQDIKPANIFVSETSSNGKHSLCFKFGDFGTSSVTPIAENGDTTGHDNGGTKMYSAPELCGLDPDVHMAERITWQADIWSFGCVLLDCGVWMTMHERGRIQFRKERVEEARSLRQNSLSMAGYSGAFHDGEQVLSTVRNKIDEIWQLDSPMSRIVAKIMTFVQKEMLLADIVARLTAQQLQARFQDAVNDPMNLSSPGMSRIPSQVMRHSMSPCRTSTGPGWDTISYRGKGKEIATWQGGFPESATWDSEPRVVDDDRESGRISLQPSMGRSLTVPYQEGPLPSASPSNHPGRSEFQQPSLIDLDYRTDEALKPAQDPNGQEDLLDSINSVLEWIPKRKVAPRQTLEWLVQPLKQVRGRDQCFIFDNSASMAPYWADVKRTGDALTYILKNADPDGFEIHMTNSGEPIKRNNRNGLFDRFGYFDQHTPRPDMGPCAMETVLSNILGAVVKKATAPSSRLNLLKSRQIQGVSVYVFTNGVWENSPSSRDGSFGEAGGVENAIKTAVKSLQDANRMRTFLSIQFISFGDNPEGRRRMSWLDDGIKNMTGGWDIVDTTHHTESVRKMIIGAISDSVDNG
ncbi:kinase-like domain-containing protein [Xylaria sp. FL0043]|nr:kinase-like domain-containing protein [Xylaria sp. FL0043]